MPCTSPARSHARCADPAAAWLLSSRRIATPRQAIIVRAQTVETPEAAPTRGPGTADDAAPLPRGSTAQLRNLPHHCNTPLRPTMHSACTEELNGKDLRPNQLFQSALPPRKGRATRVDSIAEGLWTFTQPFPIPMVGDPDLRMTVATLGDGTLLVGDEHA